jgi:hypothetical protein
MRDLVVLFLHLMVTVARLAGPGGARAAGLDGRPPEPIAEEGGVRASLGSYRWQPHCRGLYHTPMAA